MLDLLKKKSHILIAEVGVNYYDIAKKMDISLMDAAKLMIDEAQRAGADAVKFQTYKAHTLAVKNSPSYWDTNEEPTTSQYELFKKFDKFGYEEYKELSQYCKQKDIEFLSTAFDIESADYLEELMSVYKISSSDLSNIPFIEYQAAKNKPIILSVGASELSEIERAVEAIRRYNNQPIVIMHCVLEYPTKYENANLNRIITLKEKFPDVIIGYSDHTKVDDSVEVIKTAYNLGAIVIEKHFTLDKNLIGNDHYHAMAPQDIVKIQQGINFINKIRGKYELIYLEAEESARINARRSLVVNQYIKKGTILTREMLTFKRPGTGICPSKINEVIGRYATQDIEEDTILEERMLQ